MISDRLLDIGSTRLGNVFLRLRDRVHDDAFMLATRQAIRYVLDTPRVRRQTSFGVDVANGQFTRGNPELLRHLQVLESAGIAGLSDIVLRRMRSDVVRPSQPAPGSTQQELPLSRGPSRDIKLSVIDASSGEQAVLLTIFGIAAEIEDNSLIIIDEPEISLHPAWQERIVPLMVSTFANYRGCHFVIATHSPQVLTRAGEAQASVVMWEGGEVAVIDGSTLTKKSADFQLATVFNAPGYRNEYIAREALAAMGMASRRDFDSAKFKEAMALLRAVRVHMQDDDPVSQMIDAISTASLMVDR